MEILTRIACHGPPAGTSDAIALVEDSLHTSPCGARFFTHMWFKGATSKFMNTIQSKK